MNRLERIADAKIKRRVYTPKGSYPETPNFNEQIKAIDTLGGYGLPQQHQVEHGGTLILKAVRE